jgi:hypothetical protein
MGWREGERRITYRGYWWESQKEKETTRKTKM